MFNNFNERKYNLVVGAIFAATSLAGTILIYFQGWFNALPAWCILFLALGFIIAGIVMSKVVSDDNPAIRVAAYGVAASPLGMLFAAMLGKMFPDVEWNTYSQKELTRLSELGKLTENDPRLTMTYGLVDLVLVSALLCTIALVVFTALSWLLPKWLYRFKTAGILAAIAYALGFVIAVTITTGRMVNWWVFLFSIPPFACVVLSWSYQTGGPLTFTRACGTPIGTFNSIVDLAQSVND